ncbi:hypothetical protein L873DRAFT_1804651, partial [Choiromyces venosus 120613-1]
MSKGKKRKIKEEKKLGRVPDPEENKGQRHAVMVKVGSIGWDIRISRIVERLKETGFMSCKVV